MATRKSTVKARSTSSVGQKSSTGKKKRYDANMTRKQVAGLKKGQKAGHGKIKKK